MTPEMGADAVVAEAVDAVAGVSEKSPARTEAQNAARIAKRTVVRTVVKTVVRIAAKIAKSTTKSAMKSAVNGTAIKFASRARTAKTIPRAAEATQVVMTITAAAVDAAAVADVNA